MAIYDDWKLASPREDEEIYDDYDSERNCPGLRSPGDVCINVPCLECPYYEGEY